jgi:hypothetical protein
LGHAPQCVAAAPATFPDRLVIGSVVYEWRAIGMCVYYVLLTGNCGNPSLRLFGFGPVVPDGFGIGYLVKGDTLQFCISRYVGGASVYSAAG